MEVPCSISIAALFLELSVLSIKFEIDRKQSFFLKHIRVHAVHKKQMNYNHEKKLG